MVKMYPNSHIGCQFREIVKSFGSRPFLYSEARDLVIGPSNLKKMEEYGWLEPVGQVKQNGHWYVQRRVVPPMKQWADEYEEEQRKKQEQRQQEEEMTTGDDL